MKLNTNEEFVNDMARNESCFRIGATHGAEWLKRQAQQMAEDGCTTEQVGQVMGELTMVLQDWREHVVAMPPGNPWDWHKKELDDFIGSRRDQW